MSFICDGCKKPAPNGTPQNKRVTKTRNKVYTKIVQTKDGERVYPVGHGVETVKEGNFCDSCVKALDNLD